MQNEANKQRVKMLREKAVKPIISYHRFHLEFYKTLQADLSNDPFAIRYARAYRYAFSKIQPVIDDKELLVGKSNLPLSDKEMQEFQELKPFMSSVAPTYGQDSHMAIDYELLLSKGIKGIIEEIDSLSENCSDSSKDFYYSCKECLLAVVDFSNRYSLVAKQMAEEEKNEQRKAELAEIARICETVPYNAANSFVEALQSVNFLTFCLFFDPMRFNAQQFQLGHPDRYLLPFYEKDIKSGKIDYETARLYMDCLGIMINNHVPNGLSSGYMVGGTDRNGKVVQNDLTEIGMKVIDDIRLVYPAVALCYTEEMDDKYLKQACEILSHGCSHPAIFNDKLIQKGLQSYGVSVEESREYIHSTCVEITPVAASNIWVASPYHNLVQFLLDSLDHEYETVDELWQEVLKRLDAAVAHWHGKFANSRKKRAEFGLNPLLSCFVNDCLYRGKDIEKGGGRYNWIMPSFVGMANLIDSIAVIEELCFNQKKYTIARIKEIIDADFTGFERERQEFLQKVAKYGNDDDKVDKWCVMLTDHLNELCQNAAPKDSDALLVPSLFCWIQHTLLGGKTTATPDGRKAGFPLGDGSGAAQGREQNGPTASVLSTTKWDHTPFLGGVALNMKFSKKMFSEESVEKLMGLIKVYIARGGFEMQINVVDKETLIKAKEHPETAADLVVRIGGYSDYFVRLSENMQNEVILRTEHEI